MNVEPKPNSRRVNCIQCGKKKPRKSPPNCQIHNHLSMLKLDCFCRRECCEAFHEVKTRTGELAAA